MIRFKYVVNAETGDKFMVTAVRLTNDEGYDSNISTRENSYEIDLEPCDDHCHAVENIPVRVISDETGENIFMAHNWETPYQLHPDGNTTCDMDEVIASGCVLLFPMDEFMQQIYCEKRIE